MHGADTPHPLAVAQVGAAPPSRRRRIAFIAVLALLPAALLWLALETATWTLHHNPQLLPLRSGGVYLAFRQLYLSQLQLLQWEPACAAYNEAIGNYTLRANLRCHQASTEFDVDIDTNSMSFRDSEAALDRPEVVVLGGSVGMGWGVREDQTIAHLVAQATGLKTLNAGVPGYGLWQNLSLLPYLDRSALRYVVLVVKTLEDGKSAPGMLASPTLEYTLPRQSYDEAVAAYQASREPLRFGTTLYRLLTFYRTKVPARLDFESQLAEQVATGAGYDEAGRAIVAAIDRFAPLLGNAKVVLVFGINQCRRATAPLAAAIAKSAASPLRHAAPTIVSLPADDVLTREDCFVFDGHVNARGQAVYARQAGDAILADLHGAPSP
jgi:hypothetical protein